jgi:putative membrane-bound dehydrogenase-like protein
MKRLATALFLLPLFVAAAPPGSPPPKAPDVPADLSPKIETRLPGVTLTLLAEHPDLVTPTGIDVDDRGDIWLIACHTHFRPEGYQGPEHDEILVFDKAGKNRRVFYNKTEATMQLILGPDGWVYLAERDRILRIKDTDGDGKGDVEETLAALDTVADYPHNGLSGMAWHPDGALIFSLGENFGKDWVLSARDGSEEKGRGEGGVFRCTPDGKQMRRIARGFWNPFGLFVRDDGEIFAAENDPGSRPPCRLLNVVEGADYGFQWVYGSSAVHPFVAWNGELRGTLGMVHPSGEGPCAVVELGGGLLIPSWSDHRVDYYPLTRDGAGFRSERHALVSGGDHFRPVAIAPGPDGAFYLTDWVFSSYPIHARGRLWKLEIDRAKADWVQKERDPENDASRLARALREGKAESDEAQLFGYVKGADRHLADAALTALAKRSSVWTPESLRALPAADRVWALVALRRVDLNDGKWVRALWADPDPEIRFECLRWIADAVLTDFQKEVEALLRDPALDYRLFEATLAAWNTLRGDPGAGVTNPEVLADRIADPATPARLKGYALRLAPATHARITVALLGELLEAGDPDLALEAVRTLAARNADDARATLSKVAAAADRGEALRAEAIAGLANSTIPEHRALLVKLSADPAAAVREEALRALRLSPLDEAGRSALKAVAEAHPESAELVSAVTDVSVIQTGRPGLEDTAGWLKRLDAVPGPADPAAGRRVFFHSRVALCGTCHRHSGRGVVVGPDLSLVARQSDREGLLRSILEPHREVAPQYYPTQLKLADGTDFLGILLRSSSTEVFRDLTGKERVFKPEDIVERTELKTSLMPPGLPGLLTDRELRDLLAFLGGERGA